MSAEPCDCDDGGVTEPTPLRRNQDFVLLQAGQLLSTFGSSMSALAYPLLALAITHSPAKAGYVGAVLFIPLVAFNLVAGVAADRFERRRLMILADVVGAATLGTLGTLVLLHHATLGLILIAAFVDSTASIFYNAASRGAFRSVVPIEQLPSAASTVQGRSAIVRLSAPPVGGALFGLTRSLPFFADAVSYAFSTGSVLLMRTRFQEEREPGVATTLRRQFAEGILYFAQIPFLRATIAMIAVSNFTVAGIQFGVIVLAKRDGLSSTAVGGFVAFVGATTLLGSLTSPLFRRVLSLNTIMLSELWAALGYIAFLVWPNVYVLAGSFGVQAFCFPNTDAAVAAYSYALIPDRLIGRAMAASNTLRAVAAPLGPLAAGLLLDSVSPRLTIAALMAPTIAAAVLGTMSKSIRQAPPLSELTKASPSASPASAG
jgi:MFS family permease